MNSLHFVSVSRWSKFYLWILLRRFFHHTDFLFLSLLTHWMLLKLKYTVEWNVNWNDPWTVSMYVSISYPLQVEDGRHLCEASELIPDGPCGHSGEISHKRPELFIKLQPSQLQQRISML